MADTHSSTTTIHLRDVYEGHTNFEDIKACCTRFRVRPVCLRVPQAGDMYIPCIYTTLENLREIPTERGDIFDPNDPADVCLVVVPISN